MESVVEFTKSLAGLLVAIASLVVGLSGLVTSWRSTAWRRTRKKKERSEKDEMAKAVEGGESAMLAGSVRSPRIVWVLGCVLMGLGSGILATRVVAVDQGRTGVAERDPELMRRNELLLKRAWAAYEGERWLEALEAAEKVIGEFEKGAISRQRTLEGERTPMPLEYIPLDGMSESKRREVERSIFENGLLNDVGAAYWIQGRAATELGRLEKAQAAFRELAKLTYARVYDPAGQSFWSPAARAKEELAGTPPDP